MTNQPTVSFETTEQDALLINRIAHRAANLAKYYGEKYDVLQATMDVSACHCNGMPLRLQDLLNADSGNFGHDVFGIRRHLDRENGQLRNCFVPRFSK